MVSFLDAFFHSCLGIDGIYSPFESRLLWQTKKAQARVARAMVTIGSRDANNGASLRMKSSTENVVMRYGDVLIQDPSTRLDELDNALPEQSRTPTAWCSGRVIRRTSSTSLTICRHLKLAQPGYALLKPLSSDLVLLASRSGLRLIWAFC